MNTKINDIDGKLVATFEGELDPAAAIEVEKEMKKAIKAAGLDLSPEMFISLCIDRIKKDYIS